MRSRGCIRRRPDFDMLAALLTRDHEFRPRELLLSEKGSAEEEAGM